MLPDKTTANTYLSPLNMIAPLIDYSIPHLLIHMVATDHSFYTE